MKRLLKIRIAAMMLLQYMMLPVWLLPLLPYLGTVEGGADWIFAFGILTGVGTFASPVICMFADRYFNSERVLTICNLMTAALLGAAYFTTSLPLLFVLLLFALVAYMPTWSLTSAIAMEHSSPVAFPRYRMMGSIGWVTSGVFSVMAEKWFDVANFDLSRSIFAAGSVLSVLGASLAICLPTTVPKAKGMPVSIVDALGLRAFTMFRDARFAVFAVLLFLGMIPFQWYMVYNPVYLAESGFHCITMTQNVGQAAEIFFLMLIPIIVSRLGYRFAFATGFAFLGVRYLFFYAAARFGFVAGDFGGILMHGMIFGLLVIVGQMYTAEIAPVTLRNQAQGLIILLTSGLGLFASNMIMHPIVVATARADGRHEWSIPFLVSLIVAVVLTISVILFFKPMQRKK